MVDFVKPLKWKLKREEQKRVMTVLQLINPDLDTGADVSLRSEKLENSFAKHWAEESLQPDVLEGWLQSDPTSELLTNPD